MKQIKPKAYVGITGFKTEKEVREIGDMFREGGFLDEGGTWGTHTAMFGYSSSAKRLADKDRCGKSSPAANDLVDLVKSTPKGALPMIHYHTANRRQLASEVREVFSLGQMYENNYCRALQMNIDWPDIDQVENIRSEFPEMKIVLQLPARAIKGVGVPDIVKKAQSYAELVQYALIDPSGGKGKDFSTGDCSDLGMALDSAMPYTTIGFAGGLSGDNVCDKFFDITAKLDKPVFIDAQGKLRSDCGLFIDVKKARSYISGAIWGINQAHKFLYSSEFSSY